MDKKQIENLIWHIENNREVAGDKRILDEVLKSLKNNIENNENGKDVEVKIYFKSGRVGYYKCKVVNESEILELISKAIKKEATGCLKMKDMEDDKETLINAQEIATFGVSVIGE